MITQPQAHTDKKHARRSRFDRAVAMELAVTEYERVAELFDQLTPEQWAADTNCPGWHVRAMAGHMLGMVQMAASLPEMIRPQAAAKRRAKRAGGLMRSGMSRNVRAPSQEASRHTPLDGRSQPVVLGPASCPTARNCLLCPELLVMPVIEWVALRGCGHAVRGIGVPGTLHA